MNFATHLGRADFELLNVLDQYNKVFEVNGIKIQSYDERSLKDFLQLPADRQSNILMALRGHLSILSNIVALSVEDEREMIESVMDRYSLRFGEDNFLDYIEKGDIIEIYDDRFIQIYRNLEFFRLCSYTLLDLVSQEWFNLYERPTRVTEELYRRAGEVLNTGVRTVHYHAEPHVLKERFLNSRRSFHMEMKYLAPLFDRTTGARRGLIHNLRAHIVAEGDEAEKIAYL